MKDSTLKTRYIFRCKSDGVVELKKLAKKKKVSASHLIRESIKEKYNIEL